MDIQPVEQQSISEAAVDRVDDYLDKMDWEVQENSNMTLGMKPDIPLYCQCLL